MIISSMLRMARSLAVQRAGWSTALLALTACTAEPGTERAMLNIDGLPSFHRRISTSSPIAQSWFDRGLLLCFGFNHEEAVRCFEAAATESPGCAMAYWGKAYALGPNINNPGMDGATSRAAFEATAQAMARRTGADDVERALIEALAVRYEWPPPEDRSELDRAYAQAMSDVYERFLDDPDIIALCAESWMDLRPWSLWNSSGLPAMETPYIVALLEQGMELAPDHPALCHFYIHTMEASPTPELALPAANRLRGRHRSAGHLIHMPTHIDARLGDYAAVVRENALAIACDRTFVERRGRDNFYTLYRVHNYHFLVYGAMFDGQSELARVMARELVDEIPAEMLNALPDFLEAFLSVPLHVMVRFGRWSQILAEPEPASSFTAARAMWHYARGIALSVQGRVDEARAEQQAFRSLRAEVPESRRLFNNPMSSILHIADAMLEGEIEYRDEHYDSAFSALRAAVRLDDALHYDEPWGWMQPARHALGALLLEQGQVAEAAEVYREDLSRNPENGWSLHGLAECMDRSDASAEAEALRLRLAEVWRRADVPLQSSCLCRR